MSKAVKNKKPVKRKSPVVEAIKAEVKTGARFRHRARRAARVAEFRSSKQLCN
jgi:hypothetical protein